ncbi:hypothetical protein GCM10010335_65010 [Streptomyces galbus]|nr:hypothetical protein GCM10010335_65010 [Streptomyces galbus]
MDHAPCPRPQRLWYSVCRLRSNSGAVDGTTPAPKYDPPLSGAQHLYHDEADSRREVAGQRGPGAGEGPWYHAAQPLEDVLPGSRPSTTYVSYDLGRGGPHPRCRLYQQKRSGRGRTNGYWCIESATVAEGIAGARV